MSGAPVPPLPAGVLLTFLASLLVLLLVARLLGSLAARVGLPAIVGELLTGVLLGPSLLGWLAPGVAAWLLPQEQMFLLDGIGQVGLLLLVALTGTHLDLRLVRRRKRSAVTVSLCGLLIPLAGGVALGIPLAGVLAADGPDASPAATAVFPLFLGVAMCITAIPVIAKTLTDMGLLHRNIGQLTLTSGMIDDTVGWILLSVVSALATAGAVAGKVSLVVIGVAVFVLLAALVGRPLVRRVMARATRSRWEGPTVAAAVLVVLVGATATHAFGMEAVFGAFVAGIVLATAGPDVQTRLAPLRTVTLSVLAPIFLATAGLRMDLTALADPDVLLAGLAVLAVAIIGKFVGAYLGARLSGLSHWEGLALGSGMNARGVVEVVVALTGLRLGVIDTAGYTVIVLVAVVTSLMTPPLLRIALRRIEQTDEERLRAVDHATWAGGPARDEPSRTDRPAGDQV